MNTNTQGSTLDPLQRVFVPIEKTLVNGDKVFQTDDKQRYVRSAETGAFRRASPKVGRNKKERRAMRHAAKGQK